MINNLAIVQARMSSKRLPGKVIKTVEGEPLIIFLLKRLLHSKKIDQIVLVTSNEKSDDQLSDLVIKNGFKVFRGSLNNVLSRFHDCALFYKAKSIIRITGDCPLIDPFIVDELISEFEKGDWDYLTNCSDELNLSVPDGFDAEVFKSSGLIKANKFAKLASELEHVTPWLKTKEANLKWRHYVHNPRRKFFRVTLDYMEDFEVIKMIIKNFKTSNKIFTVDDVVRFLIDNPRVTELNNSFVRNEGFKKSLKEDKIIK